MSEDCYIWRILHKPTGLFYCNIKGRWNHTKTNLSKKGNFYTSEKVVTNIYNIYNNVCNGATINKAQVERYGLDVHNGNRWSYSKTKIEEFVIVKYRLEEVCT